MAASEVDPRILEQSIDDAIDEHHRDWVALRRELHSHPELSGQEHETTRRLLDRMQQRTDCVQTLEGTGLWADFDLGIGKEENCDSNPAPPFTRLAFRADIDALPIATKLTTSYASQVPNCMHACGHDVHAAIVSGAIDILLQLDKEDRLPHPIHLRAIYQPAEEISKGASDMISAGALGHVDSIYGLHVDPSLPTGKIGFRYGALTASCDVFEIQFEGTGGHTARPHLTDDIPSAVGYWITQANARIPRMLNAFHPTVISIGKVRVGEVANVIPDFASLSGTLRSTDPATHDAAWSALRRLCHSTEELFGCTVRPHSNRLTPGVLNHDNQTTLAKQAAEKVVGVDNLVPIPHPSMGAEDFSYYLQEKPGSMIRLGVSGPASGGAALHTPQFDIDERAITVGARWFATLALMDASRKYSEANQAR